MKKRIYYTEKETVHLNLNGSILQDPHLQLNGGHTGRQGAKGNSNLYERGRR